MKTSDFQQNIVGVAACMKRTMKANKGCVQLSSNDNFFSDIWFSGLKTVEEANADGVYYCGPVKTSNKGFFLSTLEKPMKYWPGGGIILLWILLK